MAGNARRSRTLSVRPRAPYLRRWGPSHRSSERENGPDADGGQGLGGYSSRESRDGEVGVAGLARLAVGGQGETAIERGLNPPVGEGAKDRQGDGGRIVEVQGHGVARVPA